MRILIFISFVLVSLTSFQVVAACYSCAECCAYCNPGSACPLNEPTRSTACSCGIPTSSDISFHSETNDNYISWSVNNIGRNRLKLVNLTIHNNSSYLTYGISLPPVSALATDRFFLDTAPAGFSLTKIPASPRCSSTQTLGPNMSCGLLLMYVPDQNTPLGNKTYQFKLAYWAASTTYKLSNGSIATLGIGASSPKFSKFITVTANVQ